MRKELVTLKDQPLLVYVPETLEEFEKGTSLHAPEDGEGWLMDSHAYAALWLKARGSKNEVPPEQPVSLPIAVGFNGVSLDVLWLDQHSVLTIAHNLRGTASAPCHYVLEVPAGWCQKHGIDLLSRLELPKSGESTH